jgi:hypothetical protein
LHSRRQALLKEIVSNRVQAGPFAGMELPDEASWADGNRLPKLLGTYEGELHSVIKTITSRSLHDLVINIGCAEGYYAIGFARAMPRAEVYAFDISSKAQRVCKAAAELNRVADRVTVRGKCSRETLRSLLVSSKRALLVLDCEGAEKELLCPETVGFQKTDILVECHDFIDRSITPLLLKCFGTTHDIQWIYEECCKPCDSPFMDRLGSFDRMLAICEFRPELMHWLFLTSHSK